MKFPILIVSMFFSVLTFAGQDVSFWSFRYLARASNSLLVASQQSLDQQKVICGIQGPKISALSQNLKALVDAKIAKLNANQKAIIRDLAPRCSNECSCDIYAYYFEQSSDPSDQAALAILAPNSEMVTASNRLACAQKFSEFCSSQLLKEISN